VCVCGGGEGGRAGGREGGGLYDVIVGGAKTFSHVTSIKIPTLGLMQVNGIGIKYTM
jgi:hypothetical protein